MTEEIKKKRVNSKNKGSSNERKVAKLLSDALSPLQFIRTPGSGAFLGGRNFANRQHLFSQSAAQIFVGDITPTNEEEVNMTFNFVVECKHYKTPDSFDSLFTGKHSIYGWLSEVAIDCVKVNKKGVVIFKWNNTPYYVAVENDIELPLDVKYMVLPSGGQKVCYLTDLLKFEDFWFTKTG